MITDHPHYFLLDPPTGPTSKGVCRECGEERTFKNSFDDDKAQELYNQGRPKHVYPVESTNVVWW